MWEKALELASHITHPGTIALFTTVLAAYLFSLAIKKTQSRIMIRMEMLLATLMLLLGLAPLLSSTFLQSRGMYRVRVTVLGADRSTADDAHVTSSTGGEPKKVEGGWEFDIPPQIRPADGKVDLRATVRSAFLTGSSMLILADDYYPTATIQLTTDTSATVRGVVLDARGKSVSGAHVSIPGYSDVATTDEMGNFALPAHAAEGQIVQIRAQKDALSGNLSAPAGTTPVELVISRH